MRYSTDRWQTKWNTKWDCQRARWTVRKRGERDKETAKQGRPGGRQAGVSDPDRNLKTVIGGPDAVLSLPALCFSFSLCLAPADEGQSQKVLFVIFWIRQISGSSCCSLGWQIESAEETKAKEKNQTRNTCCQFAWSLLLSLSLSFLTSSLISPCSRACTDITRRPAEMKQTEDKGNVKRKDVEIRSEEERWRKRTMGRERDGGFSVHLTVFSLDCFPSALELFLLCLSISLSFSYSLTLKH